MKWLLSLSIRNQMMVLIVILTIVPLGTIFYSALKQHQYDLHEATLSVSRLVDEVSNDQHALLSSTEQLLTLLSQLPAVQMHDSIAVNKLLAELVSKNPQYANLLIADRSGFLWGTAVPASGPISYADRRYFNAALSSGRFSSGEYSISRTLHKPIMSYAAPIKNASGAITDIAIVAFTLEQLDRLIKTKNLPANTSLLLTDYKGTILYVPTAPELVGKQDREDLFRRMTAGPDEGTFEAVSNVGIRRIFAYQKLRLNGENAPYLYVRAGIPADAVLAKTRTTLLVNVGLMSSILLLALAFAVYISKLGILDNIATLMDASRKIAGGDLHVRIADRVSGSELGELGRTFDEMANKLDRNLIKLQQDIALREQAENLLKQSETRFRSIIDSSPEAMHFYRLESDNRLILTGANPMADRMLGLQHSTLLNRTIEEAFPNLKDTAIPEMYRQIATGELEQQHFEIPYDDHQISGIYDVVVFKTGQRDIAVNFMNITARKHSEQELIEKEERYRELVEQSTAWVWETDADIRHTYCNRNVETILGYRVEDFLKMDIFTILHTDDHATVRKLVEEAILSRKGWNGVLLRWQHLDGSWRTIQTTGNPRHDNSGHFLGLRGIDLDVTDRVRLQGEMERAQRLESIGILAGGIAHDFNNILTGIMGNVSFARNSLDSAHEAFDPLARAEKASIRAANLARQLLIFAKGGQPVKKVFSLRDVVHETVSLVLSGTNVKGIIEIPDSLHPVEADEGQISQSLHNIIINAVQAMPEGGSLTVTGENSTLEEENDCGLAGGDYVRLSFTDDGCGIAEADQKKIFDPYFTTKVSGTGLGLATTYAIITSHGGGIFVNSSPGKGTTFIVYLPSLPESHAERTAEDQPAAVAHEYGTVLVMDDEEMVRELAQLTLGRQGYTVTLCSNGSEAIALYQAAREAGTPFSVVIMDLTIPGGMGGVETARQILAYDPEAALIVSSGYSEDPVMAHYREYGFCAAIEKPYKAEDIARVISRQRKQHGQPSPDHDP